MQSVAIEANGSVLVLLAAGLAGLEPALSLPKGRPALHFFSDFYCSPSCVNLYTVAADKEPR